MHKIAKMTKRKKTKQKSIFIRLQLLKLIQERETKQKGIILTKQQSKRRDNCINKMKKKITLDLQENHLTE